jgi:membrane protein DedA with SNARE-associated domain
MEQTLFIMLQEYGYIAIFLFLVLGIVGIPLPDEVLMTFIGYLTSIGKLNLFMTYLSALVGSASGITISYLLGRKLGYPFLKKYGRKIFITRRRLRITQVLFRKYGNWLLFAGYFIPGVRHVTAYLAGISRLSFSRFSLFAYAGAVVWCATFIGLGHILGSNWETGFEVMHKYGTRILLVALPIILIFLGWFLWNQSQNSNGLDTK